MAVSVEQLQPAVSTHASFLEGADGKPEQVGDRFWGVQVIVFDQDDKVFLRRDPDGHKLEGHVEEQRVYFPNTRELRFNSVSGGAGFWEDPIAAAAREMEEELGSRFLGAGEFKFHEDVPVFACYQEGKERARLLGGLLVTYRATAGEAHTLTGVGRFWPLDSVYRRVSPRSANDLFRPAFRIGIWIMHCKEHGSSLEEFVGAVNSAVVEAARFRSQDRGIPLDPGIFAHRPGNSMAEAV